jgi:hypothetical protein
MEEYLKYNLQKNRKHKTERKNKKKNKDSYQNNIIQFSINAINSILINNLNSSTTLGMLNIANNFNDKNKNQIINSNSYINSINDCIDYKIKGNIYKPPAEIFLNLYPKSDNLINKKQKQKKELKILKFDKEILVSQAKTPTKKISKQFCFDIMDNKNNNNNIRHTYINTNIFHNNFSPNNILNEYKTKKINKNRNFYIYRTSTTINSKEKNYSQRNSSNNSNSNSGSNRNTVVNSKRNTFNTYKKKISPDKKYIISRTNANSRENSIEKIEKQKYNISNKNINNQRIKNKNIINNKLIYKTIDNNIPKRIIIYNKNKVKDKTKITNSLKNKIINNKNIINMNKYKTDLNINKIQSKFNSLIDNININNSSNQHGMVKNYENISINSKNSPKTERNTYYDNKYVLNLNNNKINRNEILLIPNKSKNKNNNNNNFNNRNLNIQYNPTISNNINVNIKKEKEKEKESPKNSSPKNKINKNLYNVKDINKIKTYNMNDYHTINNDKIIKKPNIYFSKKLKIIKNQKNKNEMLSQTQIYNVNNNEMKNNVFDSGESSIFKILDNTQIITSDDCRSSLKSNKMDNFNGSNSNGTDANQDTDYNSLKKFNNNFLMNEYTDDNYNFNNKNNNNYQNIGNFSFNNL